MDEQAFSTEEAYVTFVMSMWFGLNTHEADTFGTFYGAWCNQAFQRVRSHPDFANEV